MDRLDLLLLEEVTRKEREHQQGNQDKKRPGAKDLFGSGLRSFCT
jgi:hypothetical protein